jgi:peptidoglycan/xylan/chitin deacetylase (PgdA/CDA1 family)
MQYLKTKGYSVLGAKDLVAFFTNQTKIPPKSVLITFDDGYSDFYTDAYPILRDLGFKSIVFVPTGLVNNPGYLSWDQISEMKNNNILFANHTWSHKNVLVADNIMKNEIETADTQLKERELNEPKVFAYPYGIDNAKAENYLSTLGYNFAFTTKHGSVLCNKQKFDLPRIRIGNKPLNGYGF